MERSSTLRPSRTSARSSENTPKLLATVFMVAALVYFLLPLFWLVVTSTKSNADLFATFGLWFSSRPQLLSNLQTLFTVDEGIFVRWFANTVGYAVATAVGSALLSTLAGYVFAKLQFPGRQALYWSVLASVMVPGTVLVLPIYLLGSQLNIINTPWGVILPSLASPFGVFLMRVFIEQSIPNELLESARMDGAGELRIVSSVVLPLVSPGFATAFLFAFVAAWNNYFLPLVMLNNPKLFTLTLGLASWNGRAGVPGAELLYTVVIIGALVSTLPLIVAFLFLQRYWRSGLTMRSVKL